MNQNKSLVVSTESRLHDSTPSTLRFKNKICERTFASVGLFRMRLIIQTSQRLEIKHLKVQASICIYLREAKSTRLSRNNHEEENLNLRSQVSSESLWKFLKEINCEVNKEFYHSRPHSVLMLMNNYFGSTAQVNGGCKHVICSFV